MKTMKWVFVVLLLAASPAFAAEWSLVAGSKDEIVFVDRTSIHQDGELKKARVLHSYSKVRTVGDEAFPGSAGDRRLRMLAEQPLANLSPVTMGD